SLADAWDKAFPDSRRAARLELMGLRVPAIEVSDHRHLARVGRPDAEDSARGPVGLDSVCAHPLVNATVAAFSGQIKNNARQQRNVVAVWIYFPSWRCLRHGFVSGPV